MGATGYVGGRLVPLLLQEGHEVRCLSRSPEKLRDVPWAAQVDIRHGDALDRGSLDGAVAGIDVVYYLVHAIGSGRDFEAAIASGRFRAEMSANPSSPMRAS